MLSTFGTQSNPRTQRLKSDLIRNLADDFSLYRRSRLQQPTGFSRVRPLTV